MRITLSMLPTAHCVCPCCTRGSCPSSQTLRYRFRCTRTDRVSWLPPGHPKAKITDAASHVREMLQNQLAADDDDDDEEEHAMDLDSDMVRQTTYVLITYD